MGLGQGVSYGFMVGGSWENSELRTTNYELMKSKIIRVGIDFDGVLAYNPFRIIRAPVTYIKRHIFGVRKTHFYVPRSPIEKAMWTIVHESSVFPAIGTDLLVDLVKSNAIEAHLVTARFSFLEANLMKWLVRHKMDTLFTSIVINQKDEQPHLYKERVINAMHFDYFIEDNLDIVSHIQGKTKTRLLWIYNILDRHHDYLYKYPYLKKALEHIKNTNLTKQTTK
jgi:hypothetical protein